MAAAVDQAELWARDPDPDALKAALAAFKSDNLAGVAPLVALASDGSVIAAWTLADFYHSSNNVEALRWYRRCEALGLPWGAYYAGCFEQLLGRHADAFASFTRGHHSGHMPAGSRLAHCYLKGRGVGADYPTYVGIITGLAAKGHVPSRMHLAKHRMTGRAGLIQIPSGFSEMFSATRALFRLKTTEEVEYGDDRLAW